MSISPIGFTPGLGALPAMPAPTPAASATSGDFGNLLTQGLEKLDSVRGTADDLAVKAATGDLRDVHDYMIASAESGLATEMVVTMKNQAVAAFNEIMRMQV